MAEPIISLQSVHKYYKFNNSIKRVLNGINLEIFPGELVLIQGKSGSGKTTLLNIIAGLVKPDGGTVSFNGKNIFSLNDKNRSLYRTQNIGFIFQQFFLIDYLTTEENIVLPGIIAKMKKKALISRLEEVLKFMDLVPLKNSYPFMLSGGQQQRVAIARAMFLKPPILLCDEPTANLDPENEEKVINILKDLVIRDGVTAVVVSHKSDIYQHANTKYLLKEGKIFKC